MRKAAGHILRALCIIGTLVCLGRAFSVSVQLDNMSDCVNYTLFQPKTDQEIDTIQKELEKDEKETYKMCAWTRQQDAEFESEERNTRSKGTLIRIKGNSDLLYNTSEYLSEKDTGGCLLTESAACELFGDTHVEEETLKYKDKKYTIRGIIPGNEKGFLIQAVPEKDEKITFDQMSVQVYETGETDRMRLLEEFESRYGIGESDTKSDFRYYKNGGAFFISILPAVVFIMIFIMAVKAVYRNRRKPIRAVIYMIALLGIAWVFHMGSAAHLSIPESWIPGQWANFDFWGQKISSAFSQFKQMLFVSKNLVELDYYNKMLTIGLLVAGAIIFWILSVVNLHFEKAFMWYGYEIMVLVFSIGVLYSFRKKSMLLPAGWIWLALYPLYFAAVFIFKLQKEERKERINDEL